MKQASTARRKFLRAEPRRVVAPSPWFAEAPDASLMRPGSDTPATVPAGRQLGAQFACNIRPNGDAGTSTVGC